MSGQADLGALGPGAISIIAELADDRVCSVRVRSSRPVHLTRLFLGRPAAEIPPLAARLFSLCGLSHAFAAARAIAAARGEQQRAAPQNLVALDCERLAETLRALASMAEDAIPPATLREAMALTRELAAAQSRDHRNIAARLRAETAALGLPADPARAAPAPETPFGRLWRELERGPMIAATAPDALRAEDDASALEGIRTQGESFAAAPSIAGRAPETGAFARHWRETELPRGALCARFRARMIDLAQLLARLESASPEDESRSAAFATREAYCALETSRGELYHWVRLTPDDRIENYAIVAPTEWNFHPAGPFVAALLGARVPRAEATQTITRLAGLFDPCVAFRVEVRDAAYA
ncbi:nickel-dependent hydrogenase large subunit [Methylosinus sp. H3A]|uniref:nickel-dependent hydrogenase large subunit n=1 Tax=Methylosinus sp. H3A TaxID=2785786 RepID=UPI0018C29667|nr:nickel-dependent hydrogenase large subunit [Methylosinus sp. H3A]MBG0809142.1 nickel-dependent hydrogenase large subunit [Methylosinus sp. H3A]